MKKEIEQALIITLKEKWLLQKLLTEAGPDDKGRAELMKKLNELPY